MSKKSVSREVSHAGATLSRLGASKGGKARAASLDPDRRRAIAQNAIRARWDRARADRAAQIEESPHTIKALTPSEVYELATGGGKTDFDRVIAICDQLGPYCLIGGLAVNCFVEPVFTIDADLVMVSNRWDALVSELEAVGFQTEQREHSINAVIPGGALRIQFTTDERYQPFVGRAERREVLGCDVLVAAMEDVFQGKLWAYLDSDRRLTKRKKDELDLLRLAEAYPVMKERLPPELRKLLD